MKTISCLLFLLTSCLAQAQVNDKAQELIALHKKKFNWLIARNYDSLNNLLDEKVLYVHSNGLTETKSDVIANLKNRVISYDQANVEEARARLFGDTGIVTGRGTFKGNGSGTAFDLTLVYTEVYVRTKKQWKLVSRHACRLPTT